MKERIIIAFIVSFTFGMVGCSDTKPPAANDDANETAAVAEPTAEPTRTPLPPNVRKDSDGNLIKPDGWAIQEIIPKDTWKQKATGKTKKGRTVIYNVLTITPEGWPVAEAGSPIEPQFEWRISHVSELSGRDGKIFCYEYGARLYGRNSNGNSAMATATSYRLCDYDGDGKYEFNGNLYPLIVPEWVKTLPGDPAAIDNNANREPDCGILCAK
ncbi:MAG TPA: hypothetical protein DEP46_10915 [Blastocatellia bacterium]|nr:hypothetical protein [Blastocatellia bacterium]